MYALSATRPTAMIDDDNQEEEEVDDEEEDDDDEDEYDEEEGGLAAYAGKGECLVLLHDKQAVRAMRCMRIPVFLVDDVCQDLC